MLCWYVNPKKDLLFKKKNVDPPPSPYPRVAIIPVKCRLKPSKLHNLCDLVPSHSRKLILLTPTSLEREIKQCNLHFRLSLWLIEPVSVKVHRFPRAFKETFLLHKILYINLQNFFINIISFKTEATALSVACL